MEDQNGWSLLSTSVTFIDIGAKLKSSCVQRAPSVISLPLKIKSDSFSIFRWLPFHSVRSTWTLLSPPPSSFKKKGTGNTIFALLAAIFVLRAVNHEKFGKIGKQSEAKGGNQFQKDGGHWLAEVVAHCLAQVRRKQRRMHPYRS